MPVSLVVLMALVAGASAVEYSKTFPYCPCQAQTKGQTYNWNKKSTKKVTGGTRYCYDVTTYEVPGSPQCTNYDLRKIELDTVTSCASYMKDITFNGETLARSNEFTPYGTVTKITRGKGLDLATFQQMLKGDVEVCYTLFGTCDTEEKFCVGGKCNVAFFDRNNKCCPQATQYSPPPPKAPANPPPSTPVSVSNFPYCPCDRTTQGPYSIEYKKATKTETGTVYCYEVTTEAQTAGKYCSSYDLRKIEFDISLECRGAAKQLTFDNQSLAPSFQLFGPPVNGLVFKVGRKYSDKNPLGTEESMMGKKIPLCFTLPDGPCSPLSKFCRDGKTCRVAFFSPNNKCCSIS